MVGKMIYKQFVFAHKNPLNSDLEYADWPAVMQELGEAIAKGFKIHELQYYASTSSDVLTTQGGINLFKNVSESTHHKDPTAAAPSSAITSGYGNFFAKTWTRGEFGEVADIVLSKLILHKFAKPIDFDPNDRLNIETSYRNDSGSETISYHRLLLHIELK